MRLQALQCRKQGNIVDEYRSLFKATTVLMQTIPKHISFKEERWRKLYADLSKTLKDDVVRLEELKAMISAGQVRAPLRAVKPGVVRAEASRMPSVDWNLHTPMVAGSTSVPQHFFERISSQQAGPVVPAADPNDPFAASAAFSTLSLAPGAHAAPPQLVGPIPGALQYRHSCRNIGSESLQTALHLIPLSFDHYCGCIQVQQPFQTGCTHYSRNQVTKPWLQNMIFSVETLQQRQAPMLLHLAWPIGRSIHPFKLRILTC